MTYPWHTTPRRKTFKWYHGEVDFNSVLAGIARMNSTTPKDSAAEPRVLTTQGRNEAVLPIETAPKDGTRILAWPVEVDLERTGSGAFVAYKPVMGWGVVSWCSHYEQWWVSPNEATEYDPDPQPVKWWMPLPEAPE